MDDCNVEVQFSGRKGYHLDGVVENLIYQKYVDKNRRFVEEFADLTPEYFFSVVDIEDVESYEPSHRRNDRLVDGLIRLVVVSELERMKLSLICSLAAVM
ncbi:MAG: hypothetical protein HC888_06645 [Candidatus Competibacteraceae bacterium]|nr:hypothetical protein [Candidatus Competibacteraceae bacterium]